jgi:3-oxoacyl-[acyl-carrier protein] reductase
MSTHALKDLVAIVTGSAKNIGREIALELVREGASVVINARTSLNEANSLAKEIEDLGGKACVHLADVSQPEGAASLIAAAIERFGRIDILVNNAAVRRHSSIDSLELSEWREVLGCILDSAYLCSKAALPFLRLSEMASITNIGGMSAHTGSKERAHVLAAKAGLIGLTKGLAHDLGSDNITVNCVVPGLIDTVRGESAGKGSPEHHSKNKTLIGGRGDPKEVAHMVTFLSGPKARYLTGQTLHVNGGAYLN